MYYNQAILWQGQGKTVQIIGQFLQSSFFSNSSLIFLFLHCRFPSYPVGALKKVIQQGEIKHKALK
jgi:hypothetical protein